MGIFNNRFLALRFIFFLLVSLPGLPVPALYGSAAASPLVGRHSSRLRCRGDQHPFPPAEAPQWRHCWSESCSFMPPPFNQKSRCINLNVFASAGGGSSDPDPGPRTTKDPEPDDGWPALRRLPGETRDGEQRRRVPGRDGLGGRRRVDQSPVHPLPALFTLLCSAARWEIWRTSCDVMISSQPDSFSSFCQIMRGCWPIMGCRSVERGKTPTTSGFGSVTNILAWRRSLQGRWTDPATSYCTAGREIKMF